MEKDPMDQIAPDTRISVAAVLRDRGRIFLARRKAGGSMSQRWELPGGKCEGDESPAEGLRREMEEEFGVDCIVGAELARDAFCNKGVDHILIALEVTAELSAMELREHDEARWFLPPEMPGRNLLVDSDARILDRLGFPGA